MCGGGANWPTINCYHSSRRTYPVQYPCNGGMWMHPCITEPHVFSLLIGLECQVIPVTREAVGPRTVYRCNQSAASNGIKRRKYVLCVNNKGIRLTSPSMLYTFKTFLSTSLVALLATTHVCGLAIRQANVPSGTYTSGNLGRAYNLGCLLSGGDKLDLYIFG